MANLRDLKKEVKLICADVASECLIARHCIPGADIESLDRIIIDTACLQAEALSRMSFSFDKQPADFATGREYHSARHKYYNRAYKSFREKFLAHVNELVHRLNAALPKPAKELIEAQA